MEYFSLSELSEDPKENARLRKKIIREAVFDDEIGIFFKVPENCSVWTFNLDARSQAMAASRGVKLFEERFIGEKVEDIDGLFLDVYNLVSLDRTGMVDVEGYSAGISFKFGEAEYAYDPRHGCAADYMPSEFCLFPKTKTDPHFSLGSTVLYRLSIESLFVYTDPDRVKDRELLRECLPMLFKIPDEVQSKMKVLPALQANASLRLGYLREAYEKFWEKRECSSDSTAKIEKEVAEFIKNHFDRERLQPGLALGDELASFAASIITPDFASNKVRSQGDKYLLTVSGGISIRFWILHCAAEFLFRDTEKESEYLTNKEVAEVIYALNRPPEQERLGDLLSCVHFAFIASYPELGYFMDTTFSKEQSSFMATLIRPQVAAKQHKKPHAIHREKWVSEN